VTSGNWNSPATWGSASYPVAGDNVNISDGHTITVTTDAACTTIVFTGPAGTLMVNSSITLTVSASITFNKQATSDAAYLLSGAGTLNCADIAVGSTTNTPDTNIRYLHTCTSTIAILNISGNLAINSYRFSANRRRNGRFNLESGVVSVSGSITTYFEHVSCEATFSMASGAQTGKLILSGTTPFNLGTGINIILLDGSSTLATYNRSGAQTVYATMYTNLTLTGSGAKTVTGDSINGILSMEATATAVGTSPIFGSASTLQYKGSASQTTGVEFPSIFPGSGGVIINNNNGVILNNNRTINYLLTFTSGKIATGTNILTLEAGAVVSGAGIGKYVYGNRKKGIATGTTAKTYEVGDPVVYAPIYLSFTGTINEAGYITARTTSADHPNINTSLINPSYSVNRYWTILTDTVSGFTSYSATFTFIAGDLDTGVDYNSLLIGVYYGSVWSYPIIGIRTSTSTEAIGLTTFGDFQIGYILTDFRSSTSGNWDQASTWEVFDGVSWVAAPLSPSSVNSKITILALHTVTVNSNITGDEITVESGGTLIVNNDFTIADGTGNDITIEGTLKCSGTAALIGPGSFALSASSDLYTGYSDGITSSGSSGSIQTSSRTFSESANYTYNGSSVQVTGNGLPESVNNLTINNSAGVTLSSSVKINGVLNLTNGELSIGSNTLTLQTSDIPLVRNSGTLTTITGSGLSFGNPGNTGGAAFTIPSGVFTSPPEMNKLSIYRTNGVTLNDQILSANGIVLCNGLLNTNGKLILLSTASGTALIDGNGTGQISGNVTMQRYLPSAFGYKYFSSPFQAATVNEFGDDMNLGAAFPSFYRYNENRIVGGIPSSGWVKYAFPDSILKPMNGYAVNFGSSSLPGTADVSGVVNNGTLALTLHNHNNPYTKGFNLVGNPYPSPIDWDAGTGWTKTKIDNAIYFFRASTTDQYGGTYSSYIDNVSSDGFASNIIPSMQGFFVHVSDGTYPVTGTLAVDNNVRITNFTPPFAKSGKGGSKPLIRLTASFSDDTVSIDPVVIDFDGKAETTFDSQLDALKLMNTDLKVPNLYAIGSDGTKLSINTLPLSSVTGCIVPLGIKTNRTGNIVFRIAYLDLQHPVTGIYLYDMETGTSQDLLSGKEYIMHLASGEYSGRFFLYINSTPTVIADIRLAEILPKTYYSRGILKVEINLDKLNDGNLVITNLLGQTVFTKEIFDSGYYEFDLALKSGFYIISIINGNQRISRKIIIE